MLLMLSLWHKQFSLTTRKKKCSKISRRNQWQLFSKKIRIKITTFFWFESFQNVILLESFQFSLKIKFQLTSFFLFIFTGYDWFSFFSSFLSLYRHATPSFFSFFFFLLYIITHSSFFFLFELIKYFHIKCSKMN